MTVNQVKGPLWTLRRTLFKRSALAWFGHWRRSGGAVVLPYALLFLTFAALVILDSLRGQSLALPGWSFTVLALTVNAFALLRRSHPVQVRPEDMLLLPTPASTVQVLLWPLLRASLLPVALGTVAWLALLTMHQTGLQALGWTGSALPIAALGSVSLAALQRDARWSGWTAGRRWAFLLGLFPLAGLLYPALTPLALLCSGTFSGWLWAKAWQSGGNPRAVRDMHFAGLVATAHRLQIPPPERHPEAAPRQPGWRPALNGPGARRALLWRSTLHLLRSWWKLPLAAILGASLPMLLASGSVLGHLPLLTLALLLMPLLALRGPSVPTSFPVSSGLAGLTRTLPASVVLGALALLGCLATVLFFHANPIFSVVTALLPWGALSVSGWLEDGGWLPTAQRQQVLLGVAFLPVGLITLLFGVHLPWLAPPILLMLGVPDLRRWLTQKRNSSTLKRAASNARLAAK